MPMLCWLWRLFKSTMVPFALFVMVAGSMQARFNWFTSVLCALATHQLSCRQLACAKRWRCFVLWSTGEPPMG
jgi:hypothetical protein